MQNKYPGKCGKCGDLVEANAGIAKKLGGKWAVFHPGCEEESPPPKPVDPNDYTENLVITKMRATLEVHLTDTNPTRAAFAKQLYEEFFGALIPEEEIPF